MARLLLPLTKNDQGLKGSPRAWSCIYAWSAIPDGDVSLQCKYTDM